MGPSVIACTDIMWFQLYYTMLGLMPVLFCVRYVCGLCAQVLAMHVLCALLAWKFKTRQPEIIVRAGGSENN